ncbi:MAG TPA: DUF4965 domain-containing protein [Acidobacteriaceae bacterium]|nr:DUF4965 domain-containing protein [Acidobacteriaceae bacterium]
MVLLGLSSLAPMIHAQQPITARTPTTPLVVHNPYFSVWSFHDKLTDGPTTHWTGVDQRLIGAIRIDGRSWSFMGNALGLPALPQLSREIWPTHVIYNFKGSGIHLTATFFTPDLPQDLDALSRPLSYLSWQVRSTDGAPHKVEIYFAASAQLAVNDDYERVVWGTSRVGDMSVMQIGSNSQQVLAKSGDNLRIDWGWADVAVPAQPGMSVATVGIDALGKAVQNGSFPTSDDLAMPRMARIDLPLLVARFDLGSVSAAPLTRRAMLAYDDQYGIELFHRELPDYWQRGHTTFAQMLLEAEQQEPALDAKATAFDSELVSDLTKVGGTKYAQLAVLAYQQTLGATKLAAGIDGEPLLFSKENFSNGCVDTVDVTYPSAPLFLLVNPKLLEAMLRPVLEYAEMPRWPWPFAPHDIGTYPLANGQVYGGGETSEVDQMPVEESGNMLILMDAIARAEGNADFAKQYWPLLTKWAEYLRAFGLDPKNQLSTDDFAGHLAHNANLSIKAILALGSYAQLAEMLGKPNVAKDYQQTARQMALQWVQMAADGDHTRLAFNMPHTWSQKYNLVWDRILDLNLFPPSVPQEEVASYLKHLNAFGLPLDYRHTYTKLDWSVWSASLASNQKDFETLIDPLYRYITETPSRVPLSDWYDTVTGAQVGFQARSVVGGVYIRMLDDPQLWHKWSSASE